MPERPTDLEDLLGILMLEALRVAIESAEWDAAEHLLLAMETYYKPRECAPLLESAYRMVVRQAAHNTADG